MSCILSVNLTLKGIEHYVPMSLLSKRYSRKKLYSRSIWNNIIWRKASFSKEEAFTLMRSSEAHNSAITMAAFGQEHAEVNSPQETGKNDSGCTGLRNSTAMHMAVATRLPGSKTLAHQTVKYMPLDRFKFSALLALKECQKLKLKVWKYFMGKKGTLMITVFIIINF